VLISLVTVSLWLKQRWFAGRLEDRAA